MRITGTIMQLLAIGWVFDPDLESAESMTVHMKKIYFIVLLTAFVYSCTKRTKEDQLIGKYCSNRNITDSIIVFNDHTYIHKYNSKDGKKFSCNGRWRYNGWDLDFHGFVFFNEQGPQTGAGLWSASVKQTEGKISLIYSSDNNIYYMKD
ncbi:hypothetical protein ACFJIV_11690 [Mucilaginibacter sp. UC70_90]